MADCVAHSRVDSLVYVDCARTSTHLDDTYMYCCALRSDTHAPTTAGGLELELEETKVLNSPTCPRKP
jgi:hypothetical protein